MLSLLQAMLITFALLSGPVFADVQEATPATACLGTELPALGAMRITDGTAGWLVCSPTEAYRSIVGASDEIVLVQERGPIDRHGVSVGHTVAYATADGSGLWRLPTASTPIPAGSIDGRGVVVIATDDGDVPALVGIDATTGEERWRVAGRDVPLVQSDALVVVQGSPEADGSAPIRAIDRVTGNEMWVSDIRLLDTSGIMVARSSAAVLGDVVVIPTGILVTGIDMRTGGKLWQAPRLDHMVGAEGMFVGIRGANSPAPNVTALDAATGDELWTVPGRPSYGGLLAVGDGVIVVLHPVDTAWVGYELASGKERWRLDLSVHVEPQLVSGTAVVGLWEGELAIVSATDGATIWSKTKPFGSPLMNSVGSNDASVFIAINSLPWGD